MKCLARFLLGFLVIALAAHASARERYDVIVVGSEPEGVMAAVAAAETGARTLLVTPDARVGGLFVLGQLNALDVRTEPLVQRGLFERWWTRVGRGSAFDVGRAEAAFRAMLGEAGVTVRTGVPALQPLVRARRVVGVRVGAEAFYAAQVVDATADGDLAAAAGADYSVGFAELGLEARMVDTLVFRLGGVNWRELAVRIRANGPAYALVDAHAAWGHFGGYPEAYRAQQPGVRLRGLNLGLQDDGSVLVNALLLYGVDPFDPASVRAGVRRARLELPRIVRYLRALPGLEEAYLAGTAERLYVRESRHFRTRCTLSVDDTLDNLVTDQDVAAGNYPLDVQTLTPEDSGYVYGLPERYGVRLCVTLLQARDNLWIAGKTAGYDPLAAASARVVPFGMALGEAVGVAAARAARTGVSASHYAEDAAEIRDLRGQLQARGAYLPDVKPRNPSGPYTHPHFDAYRTLRRKGLTLGGYDNAPDLDSIMPARAYLYLLSNVGTRFWNDEALGEALLRRFPELDGPLTPALAAALTEAASCALTACRSWPPLGNANRPLTRGEAYELAAALATAATR